MQEYIEGETKEKNTGDKKQLLDSAKYLHYFVICFASGIIARCFNYVCIQ